MEHDAYQNPTHVYLIWFTFVICSPKVKDGKKHAEF